MSEEQQKHENVAQETADKLGFATTGSGPCKNAKGAWCRRCGCAILSPESAMLVKRLAPTLTEDLLFLRPGGEKEGDGDLVCWHLADMYDFLNIGFTRTTKKLSGEEALQRLREEREKTGAVPERPLRYLTCADCEKEVLGFQFLDEPRDFYLVADRVLYEPPPPRS